MQGYDSVAIRSDIEMGGTDQKFNLLMGRTLQEQHDQDPQVIITVPILEGLDGVQRMSKSLANYIGVDEPPREMFGKAMSIPDTMIARYFDLATDRPPAEVERIRRELADGTAHPRETKAELARTLVGMYHSPGEAEEASREFDRMFRERGAPDEMPEFRMSSAEGVPIVQALAESGLVASRGEARRMIKQRAVRVDGDRVESEDRTLEPKSAGYEVQVGKRSWARIVIAPS